jgi:hypothetical protein
MFSDFSLKALHDGDQNACSATDQYIMAATSSASTGSTSNNPWIFPTCSVQETLVLIIMGHQYEHTSLIVDLS